MPSKYGIIRPHGLTMPAPKHCLRWNFCVFPSEERRLRCLLTRTLCSMYSSLAAFKLQLAK